MHVRRVRLHDRRTARTAAADPAPSKMIDEALLANADTTPDEKAHAAPEPDDTAENDRRADVRARLLRSLQDD
ncbi:hypothetical protein GCM10010217_43080 [Streptomyces tubercidicus]